ncbi:hypothetical protein E4U55_005317 [Claviceps digitariae]|nr:hypothetical protein E4U55_005317 [Claviceps digitariae]
MQLLHSVLINILLASVASAVAIDVRGDPAECIFQCDRKQEDCRMNCLGQFYEDGTSCVCDASDCYRDCFRHGHAPPGSGH